MSSLPKDVELHAPEKAPAIYEDAMHSGAPSSFSDYRTTFLSSFSAAEDKAIMRKVDRRFLLLIGLMYMLKNIDYMNAATVKVLQVGQPRNILKELDMTTDEYNWVQSIYFVSSGAGGDIATSNVTSKISYIIFEVPSNLLLKKMTPRNWQSRIIASWGLVSFHYLHSRRVLTRNPLGPRLSRCGEKQAGYLCCALLPGDDGGRPFSRACCTTLQLVPK
jgi:hypothetical protein